MKRMLAKIAARRRGVRPAAVDARTAVKDFSPGHLYEAATFQGRALRRPATVPARSLGLPSDEWILGAVRDGDARAYPLSTMSGVHVVNDILGGRPFLATFCARCYSGLGFVPGVDDQDLTFDVFGMYEGNATMIDDETGTIWAQLTGRALVGPLAGRMLTPEPVHIMTIGEWLDRHPDSLALHPDALVDNPARSWVGPSPIADRSVTTYGYVSRTLPRTDKRLAPDTYVLGVNLPSGSRAYVVDPSRPGPRLYQDSIGDAPVVLLAPEGGWPLAYDRRVDGTVLDLRIDDGSVVDAGGSVWSGEGLAVAGPLESSQLRFLPSRLTKWYAWVAAFPETNIDTRAIGAISGRATAPMLGEEAR